MSWQADLGAKDVTRIGGGDINEAYRVMLADGRQVFVKTHAAPPRGLYAAEAEGLAWLAAGPLRVPAVIAVGDTFLALEWLALSSRTHATDVAFGRGLAQLHRLGAPGFGVVSPNYLATLPQDNHTEPDIATFYVERRLRPLVRRLRARDLEAALDRLAPALFGPPEPPARLHGDLWWGNVAASAGKPVIFDPAVYGGHREIDLAMLALFGDLPGAMIDAYDEVWPLERDWRRRIPIWQLYPLAAHAVLFGGSYLGQLARTLEALV
ncbi:MAG: fructosamine kinase family protein [Kofleriaceae bacterium]|nr:fructosamine kinase family protein [Kofleriaceae bacterium]